jgi:hypothetical protein
VLNGLRGGYRILPDRRSHVFEVVGKIPNEAGGPAATMKTPLRTGEGGFMLWTIVAILLILWLLGALGTVSIPVLSGNTVHVLLVIVIIIVVLQLLRGRRL